MNSKPLRCDIFCTVIDNFGDAAVSWRLARQLAAEHRWQVRLWIDEPAVLDKLAPDHDATGVELRHWHRMSPFEGDCTADVVIEAFACDLPDCYVAAMASRSDPPVWLNLEYLSAESWIDEVHSLPSPHPRWPLTKYFFFPGFSERSGGLLREADYADRQSRFDEAKFRVEFDIPEKHEKELTVSLFSYTNPALASLLNAWEHHPTPVTLLWPGHAGCREQRGNLCIHPLPFLPQHRYDELLWTCDLNFVRGEDSFIRAHWAGKPFVWHIYPQADDAHRVKLEAFLDRLTQYDAPPGSAGPALSAFWLAWNGYGVLDWITFHARLNDQQGMFSSWSMQLERRADLAAQLVNFCRQRLK